ncbi:MAG: glycosyltransferase family 2 protein [Pseudomonadota bacterium]
MSITAEAQKSLVSVIIPTYNRPKYLPAAIASAVAQTYRNIEIIVSDNASPESPESLVRSFNDPRIRFRRNGTNVGMLANFQAAVREAKGKYVAFLHDDDTWLPEFLERLVPALEESPDLVLAFSDLHLMDAKGAIDRAATERHKIHYNRGGLGQGIYKPFIRLGLVDRAVPAVMSTVYRQDAIDWNAFPPESEHTYDLYLTYLACRDGQGAYYCPEPLTNYRVHESQVTNTGRLKLAKSFVFCYEQFLEDERLRAYHPEFRKRLAFYQEALGYALLRAGQAHESLQALLKAIRGGRVNLHTVGALMVAAAPKPLSSHIVDDKKPPVTLPPATMSQAAGKKA